MKLNQRLSTLALLALPLFAACASSGHSHTEELPTMRQDFLSFLSTQGKTQEAIEEKLGRPLSTTPKEDGSIQVQYTLDLDADDLASVNVSHSEYPTSARNFMIIIYNAQGRRVSYLVQ